MAPQNRRSFLASLGAASLGAIATGAGTADKLWAGVSAQQKRKLDRIGLQIYTVRSQASADLPGTLEKIAQAGYKEVEFAGYRSETGYYRIPPAEVRNLLNRFGLTSPSNHVGLSNNPDAWKKTLDDAKIVGHEYITAPSLPGGDTSTADGWKAIADRFNKAGAEAKAAGLKFAFHNHQTEFRDVGGTPGFDILLANTDPSLVSFQIDIYWMTVGGKNALDYFTKYPNRFPMLHVKDRSGPPQPEMVDVGKGTIDFASIFARAVTQNTKHFFVEHDNPADPMASIRASAEYLSRLEF